MVCGQCAEPLPEGAVFCPKCGATAGLPVGSVDRERLLRRPAVVTVIAVLDFVLGGFRVLAGLALLGFAARGEAVLVVLGAVILAVGAVTIAAGIGLLRLRSWSRTLQLVLSWIGLVGIPIGTIINILILVYLYRPGVRVLFSERSTESLSDEEVVRLKAVADTGILPAILVLVVLGFVAIPIIGIVAAVAIPNLLNAIDRGKQKRTMADIRSIGTAVESYAIDHDHYPLATDLDALASALEPVYIRVMPEQDGWGRTLDWQAFEGHAYQIRSAGKDGIVDDTTGGATDRFDADIVFEDGQFVQWPEWLQR